MYNTAHNNARLLFCVPFRNIRNIPNSANPLNLFLFLSQISFGFRWKYHPSCLAQIKFVYVPSVKYLGEAGAQAVADQPMRSEIMPAKITHSITIVQLSWTVHLNALMILVYITSCLINAQKIPLPLPMHSFFRTDTISIISRISVGRISMP